MTPMTRLNTLLKEFGVDYWCAQGITFWNCDDGRECLAYEYETSEGELHLALKVVGITPEQAIAATVGGRSCTSCPEMNNPDSYVNHLHAALEWHDEHVPRPTNPRGTCVVLEGKKPPEEILFIRDEGSVTHYLPEETCHYHPDDTGFTWWDENDEEHHEEHSASDECCFASCDKCGNQMMVGDEGWFDGWDEITEWTEEDGSKHKGYVLTPRFKYCPNCGRRVARE